MSTKQQGKLKMLKLRYSCNRDLVQRDDVKDSQGRRLFSVQKSTSGRMAHLRDALEPFSETINYIECQEFIKIENNFKNIVKNLEKRRKVHLNRYLSVRNIA